MDPAVKPLLSLTRLNSELFLNVLDEVNEEQAKKRPGDRSNNIIFTVCHMLDARYFLANLLGVKAECPYKALFDSARTIDDLKEYPPLEEMTSHWKEISAIIEDRLAHVDGKFLNGDPPLQFPIDDDTVLGGVAFLIQHESYHIGQLGFIRKYLGLEAMKYSS
jgi:uncharacterized damage-inducible protein DinB